MNKKRNKYYNKGLRYQNLPIMLVDKIKNDIFYNIDFKRKDTKNNLLKAIGIIYHHQISKYNNGFVSLGRGYWRKVFGGSYHERVISPLLKLGIIEVADFGRYDDYIQYRYRIKQQWLSHQFKEIYFYHTPGKQPLTYEEYEFNDGEEFNDIIISNKPIVVEVMNDRAVDWVENKLEETCRDEYLIPGFVDNFPDSFSITFQEEVWAREKMSFEEKHLSISFARQRAKEKGKDFFFFRDTFYMADLEMFLKKKIEAMRHYYLNEITKISIPLTERQSPITLRIYSHLVNLPSNLLPFVKINNKLIHQIDLRTSQFLIFANLINLYLKKKWEYMGVFGAGHQALKDVQGLFKYSQTKNYIKRLFNILDNHQHLLPANGIDGKLSHVDDDINNVHRFINSVFYEDFYEVIKQQLDLHDRSTAKYLLFNLIFKRENRTDFFTTKLTRNYSTVMSIITAFKQMKKQQSKKNQQESNFSVFLQCVEAEIYVDRVLRPLRDQGIGCFTRHDSIITDCTNVQRVRQHVISVFKDLDFQYNTKEEDMYFKAYSEDEIELELGVHFEEIPDKTSNKKVKKEETVKGKHRPEKDNRKISDGKNLTDEDLDDLLGSESLIRANQSIYFSNPLDKDQIITMEINFGDRALMDALDNLFQLGIRDDYLNLDFETTNTLNAQDLPDDVQNLIYEASETISSCGLDLKRNKDDIRLKKKVNELFRNIVSALQEINFSY